MRQAIMKKSELASKYRKQPIEEKIKLLRSKTSKSVDPLLSPTATCCNSQAVFTHVIFS